MFQSSGDDVFDCWVARGASMLVVGGGGLALFMLSALAASVMS